MIVLSTITIDGFIGHCLNERLNLSSSEDLEQIMKIRADCDAILIGAETMRKDNSTLITRDEKLIQYRQQQGKCKDLVAITAYRERQVQHWQQP